MSIQGKCINSVPISQPKLELYCFHWIIYSVGDTITNVPPVSDDNFSHPLKLWAVQVMEKLQKMRHLSVQHTLFQLPVASITSRSKSSVKDEMGKWTCFDSWWEHENCNLAILYSSQWRSKSVDTINCQWQIFSIMDKRTFACLCIRNGMQMNCIFNIKELLTVHLVSLKVSRLCNFPWISSSAFCVSWSGTWGLAYQLKVSTWTDSQVQQFLDLRSI